MNWGKRPAKATCRNFSFQFLCELAKPWKYRNNNNNNFPKSQFESMDELGKVMSQSKFHYLKQYGGFTISWPYFKLSLKF